MQTMTVIQTREGAKIWISTTQLRHASISHLVLFRNEDAEFSPVRFSEVQPLPAPTPRRDLDHYAIIGAESKKLGFQGVCPESLAALEGMVAHGFVSQDVQTAFAKVMLDVRAMFAPAQGDGHALHC